MTASDTDPRYAPGATDDLYTETVVEYVDNKRQRTVLAAILVVLFLALVGISTAVVYLTRGVGAPEAKELPAGVTWVRSIYGWGNTFETSLRAPSDAAFGPDGTIWAVSGATKIVGFNPDGSLKTIIAPVRGKKDGQVHTLEGITVGDDGTIYVTDEGKNRVIEFDQTGKWLGEWGIEYPVEIAEAPDGNLGVTARGGVAIVTKQPKLLSKWGRRGKGPADMDIPHGIVFGPDGTVYVADTQNQRVSAFDVKGKRLWTTGSPNNAPSTDATAAAKTPFSLPSGLTMDGNGRLLVVDAFKFKIFALDAKTGKITASYGDFGENDGMFGYPTGLDYDPARDWFVVADTANNRLQLIRLPDSGGAPTAGAARLFARPLWVFCLPLILLLIAVAVLVMRRRRQREAESAAANA